MKIDRHDYAMILSADESDQLFSMELLTARGLALFGICLYTGTRIAEACSFHNKLDFIHLTVVGSFQPPTETDVLRLGQVVSRGC